MHKRLLVLNLFFFLFQSAHIMSLSNTQIYGIAGGAGALTSTYVYKRYKNAHEDEPTYSKKRNIVRAGFIGAATGVAVGVLFYMAFGEKAVHTNERMTGGLHNFGSSCFMNAVLQAELNSPQVRQALDRHADKNNITKLLAETLANLLVATNGFIVPSAIHTFVRSHYFAGFSRRMQHDAAEFTGRLLDNVDFRRIYELDVTKLYICSVCATPFGVEDDQDSMLKLYLSGIRESLSLQDLIKNTYLRRPSLVSQMCQTCHVRQNRTCTTLPDNAPQRLIVNFGRLSDTAMEKIALGIPFPQQADLLDNGVNYKLQAVVVHHGEGQDDGHYTSYVRDFVSNKWYHYDDTSRTLVDQTTIDALCSSGLDGSAASTPLLLCYEQPVGV